MYHRHMYTAQDTESLEPYFNWETLLI